jgi:hypothetical protein
VFANYPEAFSDDSDEKNDENDDLNDAEQTLPRETCLQGQKPLSQANDHK